MKHESTRSLRPSKVCNSQNSWHVVLEADENSAAAAVTENDRLGAVKLGPVAQVIQLVFAEHGERAAVSLERVHARRFTVDMMSK